MPDVLTVKLTQRLQALQDQRGRTYTLLCALDGAIAEVNFWLQAITPEPAAPEPPPADE